MERLASNATWAEALRRADTAIAPLNVTGDRIPIYWVHSVTGLGTDPIRLAKSLGPGQPFYSLRAPSRNRTASFASSVQDIALYYAREVAAFQPQGPLVVGGWSAGVVVAFEMAQQLRAMGRDVRYLVAVDFAPHNSAVKANALKMLTLRTVNWLYRQSTTRMSFRMLVKRILGKALETTHDTFTTGHPLDELIEHLRYTKTEGDFVRRLHDEVDRYVPVPYPGAVLFYVAVEDDGKRRASNRNLHSNHMIKVWRFLAGSLTVSKINGDHDSLLKGESVTELARRLEADLQG
ncbi:MAG TPA: thioesterase domain-containing protein [Acidisoma sp.]|uniref:thioesterase domain-containing protein n=1 Tax=Acidisoma sp. TaxID=1872115 RepID=UPI002BFC8080|nr:thioesterase domain-containing protein [Acidisoma sp.]HTI00457.1 thioesterase domain-containing protein [Acidisoma sp.]